MTKSDRQWFDQITKLGCIVSILYGVPQLGDLQRHHVLSGGRRIDHKHSICLCYGCHQSGRKDDVIVSRHPWSAEFKRRYGTDDELLAKTRVLLTNKGLLKAA